MIISLTTDIWIAAGKVSLVDWDLFISSLGWIGWWLPSSELVFNAAIFEITSLTISFVWVPLPVCLPFKGNC